MTRLTYLGMTTALLTGLWACDLGSKSVGDEDTGGTTDTGSSGGDGDGDGACTPGDSRPANDGCNTCVCTEGGDWACTEIGCDPGPPECEPGATKTADDGCNECVCDALEQWICGNSECTSNPCSDAECGATCTGCPANDPDCPNPDVPRMCDRSGFCLPIEEASCDYDPCDGLSCGDSCSLCPPNDPDCVETDEIKVCDPGGHCVSDNGMIDCGFDPCADKICGEPCSICPPDDPDCAEDAVYKTCNLDGNCVADMPEQCGPDLGCTPGDMKIADDGCNTCTCDDTERWACTEIACDPCAGEDLPPCPPECDPNAMDQCGQPCADEGYTCGNNIGDGMTCMGGVWGCTVHPPLGTGCNLVCR